MRVGVVGAGAIGGALAALLDRAGHEVSVTARGDALAAIREHGVRLTGAWGEHTARPAVFPLLPGGHDVAIVATKVADTETAIGANRAALAGAPVLVVQNGLDGVAVAERLLPGTRVLGGLALFAASLVAPGEVRVTAGNDLYVGPAAEGDPLVSLLGDAVPTRPVRDLRGMQWSKLVVNMVNALPAITGLSVQETVASPLLRPVLTRSIQEAVRTGLASGVRFGSMNGLSSPVLRAAAVLPVPLAGLVPRAMARRMGSVPNPGSTLQSIRRGRPTEVDALNGAVVREAQRLGRSAPVNEALTVLVHEVEKSGRFVEPAEVAGRAHAAR